MAFLVCAGAGMETGSYNLPVCDGVGGGDAEVVRAAAAQVMTNARAILATAELANEKPASSKRPEQSGRSPAAPAAKRC